MPGRTIVITGASDGIGAAAARRLAAQGERVVLVGRDPARTAAVAAELGAPHHLADFAELDQVRRLGAELRGAYPRIDVLANNAGGIMGPRAVTADGFERTLQVNHLAPFLLTHLLLPTLVASRASVIATSSVAAARWGRIDLDDLGNERGYRPERAYGDAKLANVLHTVELQRRYGPEGLAAVAFHPGIVATSFAKETSSLMRFVYHTPLRRLLTITPEQGGGYLAALAAGTPGVDWQPGGYLEQGRAAVPPPQAADPDLARRLWDASAALVGV
ncbi:SDR family NAD(P)-dependent oxidoreductase [Cellulomonas sp. GbtcB1]|uniref:SDR family NAD(P)-dependent oxidoreductase n=1 Tax=Cellulomonas sp. GbtcB1 TaxID=2824746 RepID=UPI001C2FB093|nr:SDR family NAD(P)-dependent oxidoreductase [Cellulomonas sp. GbtcB1]